MVQRFVLSDLIPEHTWLNPSTSYFYFTDGEHLLTNYMMNIEKKKGGLITIHGGYMQTIGARGHVECYATHA